MPLIPEDANLLLALRANYLVDEHGSVLGQLQWLNARGLEILAQNPRRIMDADFIREVERIGYGATFCSGWINDLQRYMRAEDDLLRELSSLARQNAEGDDNMGIAENYIQYFLVEYRLIRSPRLRQNISDIVGTNLYSLAAGELEIHDTDLETAISMLASTEDEGTDDSEAPLSVIEDSIYAWIIENDTYNVFRHGIFTDRIRENYGLDFLNQLAVRIDTQLAVDSSEPLIIKQPDGFRCGGGIYITYLEASVECSRVANRRTQAQPTRTDDNGFPIERGFISLNDAAVSVLDEMRAGNFARVPTQDDGQEDLPTIAARLMNEPRFKIGDLRTNDRGEMEVFMQLRLIAGIPPEWVVVTPTAETRVNAVRVLLNMPQLRNIGHIDVSYTDGCIDRYSPEALLKIAVSGSTDEAGIKQALDKRENSRNQDIADFIFWQARIGKYVKARFNPEIKSPEAPLSGKEFIWLVRSAHYKCRTYAERRSVMGIELVRQLSEGQIAPALYTMVTHVSDIGLEEFDTLARALKPKRRISIDD